MPEKIHITWDEFHKDAKALCSKVNAHGKFTKIIAVSRGGLIPAGILSYELDIRNIGVVNVLSYDGEEKRKDSSIEIASRIEADSNTLIVDDLSDSGRTFALLREICPSAVFAAVYAKEKGKDKCDIFARQMQDSWIVFPWD